MWAGRIARAGSGQVLKKVYVKDVAWYSNVSMGQNVPMCDVHEYANMDPFNARLRMPACFVWDLESVALVYLCVESWVHQFRDEASPERSWKYAKFMGVLKDLCMQAHLIN